MKKIKYRRLAAMAASLLCCLIFTAPAYAQSSEPQPETTPAPVETEAEPETQNPFTPDGTGRLHKIVEFGRVVLLDASFNKNLLISADIGIIISLHG